MDAGQINTHKSRKLEDGSVSGSRFSSPYPPWRSQRGFPYPQVRGRSGRAAPPSHRNRSLVFNSGIGTDSIQVTNSAQVPTDQPDRTVRQDDRQYDQQATPGWITKRDRHVQLINSSIYGEETEKRTKAIDKTAKEKVAARDWQQRQRVANYVKSLPSFQSSSVIHLPANPGSVLPEITVAGMRFQVINGGSKLARVHGESCTGAKHSGIVLPSSDPSQAHRVSPKSAKVGGVTFVRSRNGNLYRSGLVKAHV